MPGPIDIHQDVAAPAAVVWSLITDIEHSPGVISGIDSVQRLDDNEGFVVGTRWRETRTMFTVTAVDPGRSYTTQAQHGKARYTSRLRVEPKGEDRCTLSMHFDAEVTGVLNKTLGAVIGRIFEGSTRKLMQRDLADIAAAAAQR
jgi:carbon monoxide dehydrogenase subunit G